MSLCVCGVNLCDVKLCDVKLCDVNLCDVNLCDVKLCDVNLCDVKLCDVNLCDVNLCGVCLCAVNLCNVNLCNVNLCAQLPRTQFTHSKPPACQQDIKANFRISCWHSYPATYTQQAAKPECQEDINAKFSHLQLAQRPRNLHTASRQTRTPGRHQRQIFASPIGAATPNTIYTQQAAKPACQEDSNATFSHLLLAQLPRTQFTHSKPPNPHARKTSTQNFRISYWHSYPEHNLHTASRQTGMPGRQQRKIFASPIGTATPNTIYTQQPAKPACQEDIKATFSHLLLAQLPRTQLTHSKPPNPNARKTSTQNFHISYWHNYPERNLQQRRPACAKAYIRPPGSPPSPTPATQKVRGQRGGLRTPTYIRPLAVLQAARLPRKSPAASAAARQHQSVHQYIRPPAAPQVPRLPRKRPATSAAAREHQSVHQTPCSAASPTPATQTSSSHRGGPRTPKRTSDPAQMQQAPRLPRKRPAANAAAREHQSVHHSPYTCRKPLACHAKVQRPAQRPANTKAYIRPPADAASPTPATQTSSNSAAAREHQSVHQTPVQRPARRPANTKAYIGPRADAASPTPATQTSSGQRGGPRTPKRTSEPLRTPQFPRLPHKRPATSAAPRKHQSVHQTPCRHRKSHACHANVQRPAPAREHQSVHQAPCRRRKSHACHANVQRPARRPANTKAYIRPRADAPKSHACHAKAAVKLCCVVLCCVVLRCVVLC